MRPCLFCGSREGRPSVEHVIPQWARRSFAMQGPATLYAADAPGTRGRRRVAELQHLNVTLKGDVCSSCNSGVLSRIENAVRPILGPMAVSATATDLDPAAQAALATWALKTVLLFELAARQRYPGTRPIDGYVASPLELAWVATRRRPPPRSLVWLGCWDCKQDTPVMYEPSGAPLPTADGFPVTGHMTTFALGFVAFQVFSVDFLSADQHQAAPWNGRVPPSLAEALVRIWPPQARSVPWPPHAFAYADWNRLVTWDGVLRPKVRDAPRNEFRVPADAPAAALSPDVARREAH